VTDDSARPLQRRQTFPDKGDLDWSFADRLGDMISAHAPDETYRYVSAAAKDLLGYEPEELLGTRAYDHFHPDDVPKVGASHRSALGGAPFTIIYRMRRKNGEYVWVETTNRIVTDAETGEVVEVLSCTREVEHREAMDSIDEEERDASMMRVNEVLADEAIAPVFQPIVELKTGRAIGYEALSRFPGDPAHTPDRWFDDAWRVGLGIPLELLAVRVAATALPRLQRGVGLSINASPPAVAAQGFLQSLGGDVDRVAVEITEHLRVDDYEEVSMKLAALRKAGGQVAIDDFGAGYASLQHILKMSPEWIKLDTSLTERIGRDSVAQALVTALVSFTDSIGVRVVAEGIEDADGVEMLSDLGIRFGQGFHLGRPAPLDEALALS
jgi:PAS domain S-box-containing protein